MPPYIANELNTKEIGSSGFKRPDWVKTTKISSHLWLLGKQKEDKTNGLWRVHDGLYDFSSFADKHPGGSTWLNLSKGTDITEAFEAHHITSAAEKLLKNYFVMKAATPRNSPYTYKENGFYKTLKRNVLPVLKTIPKDVKRKSKNIADFCAVSTFVLAILAAFLNSYLIAILAGIFLTFTNIAAHNFSHQKDNFRMYYMDLSLMSSREWRISHVLSHHLYTNSWLDLEITHFEPFLQYFPTEKSLLVKYGSWIYGPLVYAAIYLAEYIKSVIGILKGYKSFTMAIFIPFTVPMLMYFTTSNSLINILKLWFVIVTTGSFHFGLVALNASHHHPKIFHDGDTPRQNSDWGMQQLDAIIDRKEMTGNSFIVLTNFGDHALHHMFPRLDHLQLPYLWPVFEKTCKQFGIRLRVKTQMHMIAGQLRQLARSEPNKKPPK